MFVITAERPGDGPAIETLLDRAFGPGRHEKAAYRYRRGITSAPGLSLVALERGMKGQNGTPNLETMVGSIRFWPVSIGADTPALLLGPLAVATGRGGEGIGRALMRQSLDLAQMRGHRIVLLVGPLDYYGQYGFRPAGAHGITMTDEARERLLVAELAPDSLVGIDGDPVVRRWVRRRTGQSVGKTRMSVAAWRRPRAACRFRPGQIGYAAPHGYRVDAEIPWAHNYLTWSGNRRRHSRRSALR